jgi:hypothetical protein
MTTNLILRVNEYVMPERHIFLYQCFMGFDINSSFATMDYTGKQFGELFYLVGE